MKQQNFIFENKKRTILIADDELINREILGNLLVDTYDILYATDGVEAYDLMSKNADKITLVLLDLIMPKMTGLELLSEVKDDKTLSNIPIIVVTSDSLSEEKSLELGAIDFIPKPYPRQSVILARIKRVIVLYEDKMYASFEVAEPIYLANLGLKDGADKQVRKAGTKVATGEMTVDEAINNFGNFS